MKLYGSRTSPYVRKVSIVMIEKRIECDFVEDNVWGAETKVTPTTTGAATTREQPAAIVVKPNPWYPDHALYNATKDELKALPEFKYSTL